MSKLIKNTIFYTIGNFLPTAGQFILLPIYTQHLPPEDYGIINSLSTFNTIFSLLITLSIGKSIYLIYYDYKTTKEHKDLLGTISIGLFFLTTISTVLAFLLNPLIGQIFKSIDF